MKNENPRFCRANASYSFILLTNGLSDNKPSWKMGWRHSGGRSGQAAKPYSKLGIINRLFADGVNPIRTTPSVQPHLCNPIRTAGLRVPAKQGISPAESPSCAIV